jgi:hypothetical protein
MKEYWFVPKSYGYGLTPIAWQGWVATGGLVLVNLGFAYANNLFTNNITPQGTVKFVLELILSSAIFLLFAEKKTKGEIKWCWGRKDKGSY